MHQARSARPARLWTRGEDSGAGFLTSGEVASPRGWRGARESGGLRGRRTVDRGGRMRYPRERGRKLLDQTGEAIRRRARGIELPARSRVLAQGPDALQLLRAPERLGLSRARVQQPAELVADRNPLLHLRIDQLGCDAVTRRKEAVLVQDLRRRQLGGRHE